MKELVATGDLVLLSALKYHLDLEGIAFDIFDGYVGSLFPGDLSIASTRVMVDDDDLNKAQRLLSRLQNEGVAGE